MLRSTGFFRGIDCPFYNDGKSGCNRPYCHFRHSKHSYRSSASPYGVRGTTEEPAQSDDQGYDPFSPEVVRPTEQYNAESEEAMHPEDTELELVNKAIEAVQSELEKGKKKLSQIGKQGYDPANSSLKAGYGRPATSSSSSHSAYDPGSYQMGEAVEYNPTPRFSKYTLEPENGSSANSMEYVPTAVSKPVGKKGPPVPRVTRIVPTCSSSSKRKYTLDNSRPPTDMEYDPLSNFSAKPVAKSAKDSLVEGEGRKRVHQDPDEEYVPTVKKARPLPQTGDTQKYTVNFESDEESSGNEYRPTPRNHLERRRSSAEMVERDQKRPKGEIRGPKHQAAQESSMDDDEPDDFEALDSDQTDEEPKEKKGTKNSSQIKSIQTEKVKKDGTTSAKKTGSHKEKKASGSTEKPSKKSSQESQKEDKSHGRSSEEKVRTKERDTGKEGKEVKSKKPDKPKGEQSHKDKERGNGEAKKPKTDKGAPSGKESSKYREQKNGKLESSRERDKKKSASSSKDKSKQSSKSLEKKDTKAGKSMPRSLSHADLFGDESPEEEEDDEDERIVRKSASAFKRSELLNNKRKASDATDSSSEDDVGECERADVADDDAVDFSALQEDLDFDSDPMEECLRIFNESKYVKTEDKGRQAKQPSMENEDDMDDQDKDSLTTLFPGQKKRVSHFKAKGSTETSLNALPKPQRRLTAQEVCYQRMQIAQQQAAQLAAAVKNAASGSNPFSSSSTSTPGEKRRVMHKPNPALVSAKPVLSDKKQTPHGAVSPRRSVPDQSSVKAYTSASMLSKTSSTTSQKRVAHTPSLKSSTMKRPVIPTEFGAKVPTNVRQRYLNIFIDECVKFCSSEEEAFQMALDEEKLVYDRSSSKNIYLNVAVNTLKKLRSKSTAPPAPARPAARPAAPSSFKKAAASVNRKTQSHEGVLGGRLAATTSYTINRMGKQQDVELKGALLYQKLKMYVMSEEQLQEHGYPRPHPERLGHAIIYNAPEKKNNDPFSKVCCRCGAEYKINASGSCVRKEECYHHWGRLRRYKVSGGWETQYNCCSGAVGSPGCQVSKQHVQDGRKESLDSYVQTFSKPLPADGNGGVFALDCEMVRYVVPPLMLSEFMSGDCGGKSMTVSTP